VGLTSCFGFAKMGYMGKILNKTTVDRNNKILELCKDGVSFINIAKEFNISRQRVYQIYHGKLSLFTYKYKKPTWNRFEGRDNTRELVRIRDRYQCQLCGILQESGKKALDIHHIEGGKEKSRKYDKISKLGKMITLCHKCHGKIHSGIRVENMEQFIEILTCFKKIYGGQNVKE